MSIFGNRKMKTIPLTKGMVALVDDVDYDRLNNRKWYAAQYRFSGNFYAQRAVPVSKGKRRQRTEFMHRLILGLQPGDNRQCDHRDGNGLNNRRSNLRVCTATQNGQSRRKRKPGTSRYKGVCWHCGHHRWQSYIGVNGKLKHIGYFDSETAAARAYDAAASKHHREFALTNETLNLY